MHTPLLDAVERYTSNKMRFHMPGHKGDMANPLYLSAGYDVTELDFSDNLLRAEGVILESEQLTARAYGVKRTLYVTTGTTTAIFAMMHAVKGICDRIAVLKNSHRSIWNALAVTGIEPSIIDVSYSEDGLPVMPTPETVKAFVEERGLRALIVTTPDYYGRVMDIASLRELLPDTLILVDAAHGAHFSYSSLLPTGAEEYADMTVMGAHKTLPVYTGGAYLHVNNPDLIGGAEAGRRLYHSTSPSYLVMCSMDYTRAYYEANGEILYRELIGRIDRLSYRDRIEPTDDPTRILLRAGSGRRLYDYLKERGVYCECYTARHVVAIATPHDLDKLEAIDLSDYVDVEEPIPISRSFELVRAVRFVDTIGMDTERVSLRDAVGRIAGSQVGLYPPGSPIIVEGEIYSEELVDYLDKNLDCLYGVDRGEVVVLRG